MQLIIDCKENSIFVNKVKENIKLAPESIKVESLDVGDIAVDINLRRAIIIERKSINDLAASIGDGRYHEQKARLRSLRHKMRIFYLIEGNYQRDIDVRNHARFDYQKYKGVIINTMIRDGITVIETADMDGTVNWLNDVLARLPKYDIQLLKELNLEAPGSYVDAIMVKKRDNVTPQVCFINQMRQIPGVSLTVARALLDNYHSVNGLITRLTEYEGNKELMLKDHQINNKKLGPVVSTRIYKYLFGIV